MAPMMTDSVMADTVTADTMRSPVEAFPWLLTCRGKFLSIIPGQEFCDDDDDVLSPRRARRASSVPASLGRCGPSDGMELYADAFLDRLDELRESAMKRRGFANSRDILRQCDANKVACHNLDSDTMDHQTFRPAREPIDMTKYMSEKSMLSESMLSETTTCPGIELTHLMSDRSTMTRTPSTTWSIPSNDHTRFDAATKPRRGSQGSTMTEKSTPPGNDYVRHGNSNVAQSGQKGFPSAGAGRVAPPAGAHGVTLMVRNIPCRVTDEELLKVIHEKGFAGRYDFVYLPKSHRPTASIGYAFVNMVNKADEDAFTRAFEGYRFDGTSSSKVCTVQPARIQGSLAQLSQRRKPRRVGKAAPRG